MDKHTTMLIMAIGLFLIAMAGFAAYHIYQQSRHRLVAIKVRSYLNHRFGRLPQGLHINCSNDTRWPVLVNFLDPTTQLDRRLTFAGSAATRDLTLLSEKSDRDPLESTANLHAPAR